KYTSISFFFFQAEDGIRDRNVTGVQTCALPISTFAGISSSRDAWSSGARLAKISVTWSSRSASRSSAWCTGSRYSKTSRARSLGSNRKATACSAPEIRPSSSATTTDERSASHRLTASRSLSSSRSSRTRAFDAISVASLLDARPPLITGQCDQRGADRGKEVVKAGALTHEPPAEGEQHHKPDNPGPQEKLGVQWCS